jgi:hypothetical protein
MWGGGKLEIKIKKKKFGDKSCLLAKIVEKNCVRNSADTQNVKFAQKNFHYKKDNFCSVPFRKKYCMYWCGEGTVQYVLLRKTNSTKIFLFLENKNRNLKELSHDIGWGHAYSGNG